MNYKITNGLLIDPVQKMNTVKQDLLIKSGAIVSRFDDTDKFEEIDCSNMIVMAGAIDMHTHIGGGKANLSRMLLPEDHYLNSLAKNSLEMASSGYCTPGTYRT